MKILFIQHEFHFKSKSSDFFLEVLFNLKHQVILKSRLDDLEYIDLEKPDLIILWQSDHLLQQLKSLNIRIICIPMLDDSLKKRVSDYSDQKTVEFMNFSIVHHYFLRLSGLHSVYVKYWPIPCPGLSIEGKEKIFFWERNPSVININNVLRMIGSNYDVIYRKLKDPHDKLIFNNSSLPTNVVSIDNEWMTKEEYLEKISDCSIFVAPRKWEGIGMAFLEAMARGKTVLAFDNPTMNEYINNKKNGILFNSKFKKIELIDSRKLGIAAFEDVKFGREAFEKYFPKLVEELLLKNFEKIEAKKVRFLPKKMDLRLFIFLTNCLNWYKISQRIQIRRLNS